MLMVVVAGLGWRRRTKKEEQEEQEGLLCRVSSLPLMLPDLPLPLWTPIGQVEEEEEEETRRSH